MDNCLLFFKSRLKWFILGLHWVFNRIKSACQLSYVLSPTLPITSSILGNTISICYMALSVLKFTEFSVHKKTGK